MIRMDIFFVGDTMKLFSNTINLLEQGINQSTLKQNIISNNIANVDTPNFKSQEVQFKSNLNSEMQKITANKTQDKHIDFGLSSAGYKVVTKNNTSYQQNGNNVDIDEEMTDMAKNQIQYNALIDRLSSKFNSLTTVIKGGK